MDHEILVRGACCVEFVCMCKELIVGPLLFVLNTAEGTSCPALCMQPAQQGLDDLDVAQDIFPAGMVLNGN